MDVSRVLVTLIRFFGWEGANPRPKLGNRRFNFFQERVNARLGEGGDEPLPYIPYTLHPTPSTPDFGYFRIK
jgi:hypothetical protein